MSIITEGTEWQVRALADAAQQYSGSLNRRDQSARNYAQGVEDALRFLLGEVDLDTDTTLRAIHELYIDTTTGKV